MNVDQFLQRVTPRDSEAAEADNIEDLGGFGLLRGIRDRAFAVEFRKKDGTILAIPYALIEQMLFSPEDGITLRASGREIRVTGTQLDKSVSQSVSLFSALVRQRTAWVAEKTRAAASGESNPCSVTSIRWFHPPRHTD